MAVPRSRHWNVLLPPTSPYGEWKLFIERPLRRNGEAHGLRWCALRYFNAAGADPDGELGEEHEPETHLIPLAILAALGQRPHVEIFGTDYPTPDGTAIRDYIHVMDLARAHALAIEHLMAGHESEAFNLGNGRGHSVLEVIATVERVLGRPVPIKMAPRRNGDAPHLVADSCLARRTLGWRPEFTRLDAAVESAAAWYSSRLAAKRPVTETADHPGLSAVRQAGTAC